MENNHLNKRLKLKAIMLKLSCILIFLFPAIVFGQDSTLVVKDFNKDGYQDTLISYYSRGSGCWTTYVTLINGKTKEIFELETPGFYGHIKQIILIPPKLLEKSNKQFLEAMKKELLPSKKDKPDASLQWLITANLNSKKLSNNNYYDLIIKVPPQWISDEIKFPSPYYIDVKGDTLRKLYYTDADNAKRHDSRNLKGWLIYDAPDPFFNQKADRLVLVDTSPDYKVFRTSHSVVVKKGDLYACIFITDYDLTGGPAKLRWQSIGKVKLFGKYVIVHLINSEDFGNPIFIIDIEKGIAGRLRCDRCFNIESFEINNDKIIIKREQGLGTKSYKLEQLINELNKL
jgi:hypothetical protein